MSTFHDLPFDVLEIIFSRLDHKSLLAMRKVCKITKEIAELTVMKNPLIGRIKLSQEIQGEIVIEFSPDKLVRVNRLPSKLFMVSAVNYLPGFSFDLKEERLFASMASTEITSFFNQFTLFTRGFSCKSLEVLPLTSEMVNLVSNIFNGKTVPTLAFKLDGSVESRNFIERLIEKLQSTSVQVHLQAGNEGATKDSLSQLAKIVDRIIIISSHHDARSIRLFAYIILAQRCSYLEVSDGFSNAFSLDEARALSSVLSILVGRKQFYFVAPTKETKLSKEISRERHVIEVFKRLDKNVIEVKHGMSRAQW